MTHQESNPPRPMPCVIYAARSAPDEDDSSVRSQVEEIRERIASEGGREVADALFTESGWSGYHGERGPELDAAMAAAIAAAERWGEAELWVFHSSRLARGSGRRGKRSLNKIHADLLYGDVQIRSVSDDEFVRNPMLVGIASSQNHKYGQDHGAHVARGKRAAHKAGRWTGGPSPDGYIAKRRLDNESRKEAWLEIDPERAPVIRVAFDLSEEGLGDAAVARRMNEAGHRTKAGKPWNRRRVQHTVTNPVYAGRVVRKGEGSIKGGTYQRFDEPQVVDGLHPALVEPERFDRILAARAERDRAVEGRRAARARRGGRPTMRYALAKLATCDRCEERMYALTSPYKRKRKGGTQARRYVCANVKASTGLCDQPPVDAEKVDSAIVAYLGDLFVDFEAFLEQLSRGADQERGLVQVALDSALNEIDRLDAGAGKHEADYARQVEAGDETRADLAARNMERVARERRSAEREVERCRRRLAKLDGEPANTVLDTFNALRDALRGTGGTGLGELNERLREEFEEFRLDTTGDGTVCVQPVLRAWDPRALAAHTEWADEAQGMTQEEVEDRLLMEEGIDDGPIWATGEEEIRPPAKPLAVIDQNLPYSHE